ncbi:ankyrin repeat domain-containing protein [Algoriphagus sp. H41]|uniref:Ankyrin repeat domain-containing protein n=1 Tax=Algoriphagus oliviformis TaxID=2811231 RepID=A0ABS3C3X1_9BACT|nr:ankyrin repeat domain-containing protein [Algoriphagus oliviformis]MBN7810865.1 ankyrin repeat domain-containing protein [Algoriphagus oliviformis]
MISSLPVSLVFLAGKTILKFAANNSGELGSFFNFFSGISDDLLLRDFQEVAKRKEVRINGSLHRAFVSAVKSSVGEVDSCFRKDHGLNLSISEQLSQFPSDNKIIRAALKETCEKVLEAFCDPDRIKLAYDQQVQIHQGEYFFHDLIDQMLENGQKLEAGEKVDGLYLSFSNKTEDKLLEFLDVLKDNLYLLFSEYFLKELKSNETAFHAYSIHINHTLLVKQTQIESRLMEGFKRLTQPPLSGLLPNEERAKMELFTYQAGKSQYVGRKDAVAYLNSFLADGEKFRWLVITGEGGSGKSRLAYECCRDLDELGWEVGFYEYENDPTYSFNRSSFDKNTLIIFDYVGVGDHFEKALSAIRNLNVEVSKLKRELEGIDPRSETYRQKMLPKVRFVLLERFLNEHQLNDLNDQKIRFNYFPKESLEPETFSQKSSLQKYVQPFKLRSLSDSERWDLFRQVSGYSGDGIRPDVLRKLASLDGLKRPLFVFIVAEAFKETGSLQLKDRTEAIEWYVQRLESRRWRGHPWYANRKALKNMVWLATAVSYLELNPNFYKILRETTEAGLPCFPQLEENIDDRLDELFYREELGGLMPKYLGLQPDIVAEYFIIKHLFSRDGFAYFEKLLEISWTYFPKRTQLMLSKAARDYRDDPDFQKLASYLETQEYEQLGIFFYNLASEYFNIEDYEKCAKYPDIILRLLERQVPSNERKYLTAYTYQIKGMMSLYQQHYEDAYEFLTESLALKADNANAHYVMFNILLNTGQKDEAFEAFRAGLAYDNKSPSEDLTQANLRFSQGKAERAWYSLVMAWIKEHKETADYLPLLDYLSYIKGNPVIQKIEEVLAGEHSDQVMSTPLPFLEGMTLYEFHPNFSGLPGCFLRFVADGDKRILSILNGTSTIIRGLIGRPEFHLDADNVGQYLEFFTGNIMADAGSFEVVRDPELLPFIEENEITANTLKYLQSELKELDTAIYPVTEGWQTSRILYYSSSFFLARFLVKPGGEVVMQQDIPKHQGFYIQNLKTYGPFYRYEMPNLIKIPPAAGQLQKDAKSNIETWIKTKEGQEDALYLLSLFLEQRLPELQVIFDHSLSTGSGYLAPLSFYRSLDLLEFDLWQHDGIQYFTRAIVKDGEYVQLLDGKSHPIYALNSQLPVRLNIGNVDSYLEFFCANLHADMGFFDLINHVSDLRWISGVSDAEKERIASLVQLCLTRVKNQPTNEEKGLWLTERLVQYSNSLFITPFSISKNGVVAMMKDIEVISEMPIEHKQQIGMLRYYAMPTLPRDSESKTITNANAASENLLEIIQWKHHHENQSINKPETCEVANYEATESTALIVAARAGFIEIVQWILSLPDIDLEVKDSLGKTALDWATEAGHETVARLLQR